MAKRLQTEQFFLLKWFLNVLLNILLDVCYGLKLSKIDVDQALEESVTSGVRQTLCPIEFWQRVTRAPSDVFTSHCWLMKSIRDLLPRRKGISPLSPMSGCQNSGSYFTCSIVFFKFETHKPFEVAGGCFCCLQDRRRRTKKLSEVFAVSSVRDLDYYHSYYSSYCNI